MSITRRNIIAACLALFTLLLITFSSGSTYAQDSLKIRWPKDSVSRKDSALKPLNFFFLKPKFHYFNQVTPDTISRNRFLWLPLKEFEEVLNYLPGYYMKFMDVGQRQNIGFNQMDGMYTALLRNGRPINDLLDGSADINLFSRNEISEIETDAGFGSNPYNYQNTINVIQRQIAQNRPYSEMSFWQDRYENLYLDANFQQNLSRRLNFNFGITKHSYDGKFTNSDFDKWLGRFNFNYAFSNKVNAFLYTNYSHVQRGLNSGVNSDTVNVNDKNTLFDASLALVRNPDAYEINARFDVDLGAVVITSKDSLSFFKLQAFTSNSLRKYRDEENRPNPNGIYLTDNSHWIDYGFMFQNVLNSMLGRNIRFNSNTELEYNKDYFDYRYADLTGSDRLFLYENVILGLDKFEINAFGKAYKYGYFLNKFFGDWGIKPSYSFAVKDSVLLRLYTSYGQSAKLPTYQQYFLDESFHPGRLTFIYQGYESIFSGSAGFNLISNLVSFRVEYFFNQIKHPLLVTSIPYYAFNTAPPDVLHRGFNAKLDARVFSFDINATAQYAPKSLVGESYDISFPELTGNVNVGFHNVFFRNKLELKIGVNTRFWTSYTPEFYYGYFNLFTNRLVDSVTNNYRPVKLSPNATLDFYMIAKINKAVFGLTFENLLNRIIVTEGFYPYMDRGGLANVISRFNITWYFLN